MDATLLTALIGAAGLAIGALIQAVLPKKGSIDSARIESLMAERKEIRAITDSLTSEVAEIRAELDEAITARQKANEDFHKERLRALMWRNHYLLLVQGVENGTMPPFPPLPATLENHD